MKHLFIRNLVTNQTFNDASSDKRKKWFEEHEKLAKNYGLKLIFHGTPWGIPESYSIVYESDKSLDNFVTFLRAWYPHMEKHGLESYWTSGTTVTIIAP